MASDIAETPSSLAMSRLFTSLRRTAGSLKISARKSGWAELSRPIQPLTSRAQDALITRGAGLEL